ncbi:hypothetical protein [Corynebacterium phoceense]|uniref:hypothetical protein n=1 Tax=Corynebacterium phoceense TaxID=1686286 RepID=UPI00215C1BF6|nr:hypothetical protein [Corynebacterium phoceense]
MSRSKTFLRRNPVTLLLIVIVWALWILGASDGLLDDLSVHTAGGAFMLTLLALAVDIPAERTLGWNVSSPWAWQASSSSCRCPS